jgi:hypothetical protein
VVVAVEQPQVLGFVGNDDDVDVVADKVGHEIEKDEVLEDLQKTECSVQDDCWVFAV